LFVASDLGISPDQLLFAEDDSCRELEGWIRVRMSGVSVDFRCILTFEFGLLELRSYPLDDSAIEEFAVTSEYAGIESRMSRRLGDGSLIVVNSIWLSGLTDTCVIEQEIANLINLGPPCITAPIWFVFRAESRELKIGRFYSESGSLAEVVAVNPAWWTPTAKAKAVAGLVPGLRFAHSFGLIHGRLMANHILFDADKRIQITMFLCGLSGQDICGFSAEKWSLEADVRGFTSLFFRDLCWRSCKRRSVHPSGRSLVCFGLDRSGAVVRVEKAVFIRLCL
jgi:hypothetical protein